MTAAPGKPSSEDPAGDASPVDRDPSSAAAASTSTTGVDNPALDPANESGGRRPIPDTLDQLYDTLGAVRAGMDVRDQEADELRKQLADQEQALLEQRNAAVDNDDQEAFAAATDQLEQLEEAWRVLDSANEPDEEPADAPQPEPEASVGDADERDRDGDDRGAGTGEPPAGGGPDSELQRGAGGGGAADDRD